MDKPTEAQIKELWEWCDCLEIKQFPSTHPLLGGGDVVYIDAYVWKPTGQRLCHQIGACEFPAIDLNNLFKYAVPKLHRQGYAFSLRPWRESKYHAGVSKAGTAILCSTSYNTDPALALFWAIYEVIKEHV